MTGGAAVAAQGPGRTVADAARGGRRLDPRRLGFAAALVALVVVFAARSPAFLQPTNLRNVVAGGMILLIVSLAMTLVVSSGGIDLSVGTSFDVGAWVVILAMTALGLAWGPAILLAVLAGLAVGALNSTLIARLGVSPFLATLGVFFVGRSVQQVGTGGGANVNFRNAPPAFHEFGVGSLLGVPIRVWLGVALLTALWFVMTQTTYGRRLDVIGLQPEVARHSGLKVRRDTATAYLTASALCAFAGVMLTAGVRIYTPHAGFSYQTDAIAAVFIGASLHARGRPNVPGTLLAVLFLAVLGNGLDLVGLDFNVKELVRGAVLVLALVLSFGLARRSVGHA